MSAAGKGPRTTKKAKTGSPRARETLSFLLFGDEFTRKRTLCIIWTNNTKYSKNI